MPPVCPFVRKVAHLAVSAQSSIDFGGPVLQGAGATFPGVAALVAGVGGQILAADWVGEVDIIDTATFRWWCFAFIVRVSMTGEKGKNLCVGRSWILTLTGPFETMDGGRGCHGRGE